MRPCVAIAALLATEAIAAAEPTELSPQVQADLGLAVVGVGYEHPISEHVALQGELEVFGTYFLPWFDAGDNVKGLGFGIRPTWFQHASGHGLYVTPYFRGVAVDDASLTGFDGLGFEAGAFVGWAFRLTHKLDLRIGGGAQYIHFHVDTPELHTSTPFVALDAVLGWRL